MSTSKTLGSLLRPQHTIYHQKIPSSPSISDLQSFTSSSSASQDGNSWYSAIASKASNQEKRGSLMTVLPTSVRHRYQEIDREHYVLQGREAVFTRCEDEVSLALSLCFDSFPFYFLKTTSDITVWRAFLR